MTAPDPDVPLWRLRPYLRPFSGIGTVAVGAMAARAVVLVLMPWPLKFILDSVVMHHLPPPSWLRGMTGDPQASRMMLLNLLVASLFVLGVADAWLSYVGNLLFLGIGQRIVFAIRRDLFAHLQRLPLSFHRGRRGGDLMTRMTDDISRLQNLIVAFGSGILPHVLTIFGMIAVMVAVDWRYALAALAVAPLLMLITRITGNRQRALLRLLRTHDGDLWSMAQETLGVVALVQACRGEAREDRRFAAAARLSLDTGLKASRVQSQFAPLINLVIAFSTAGITWYGVVRVLHKDITAGELLVFLAYMRGLVTPARQLAKTGPVFSRATIALGRLREVFATQASVADRTGVRAPPACHGHLEYQDVSFGHKPGRTVLHDISFGIEPGQMIALVGPSGSGKSTLASLAARFADPATGAILLDGCDLRDLPLAHVRRNVMFMQQEALLLHGTVWENIAYGRDGATREEAIEAARAVGVDAVLNDLRDGYNSLVGERGALLSGGQRQCIAIARAMLSEAPVVILDEPSSNLDALTESRIVMALRHLAAERACIVIAHRLVSVSSADRILVMEAGQIVQSGTHAELLAAGGLYARMWRSQTAHAKTIQPAGLLQVS